MGAHSQSKRLRESDLASDKMGNNQLQGDDQTNVTNERQEVPDVKTTTDGVIESFKKTDKDERARKDMGKGNKKPES